VPPRRGKLIRLHTSSVYKPVPHALSHPHLKITMFFIHQYLHAFNFFLDAIPKGMESKIVNIHWIGRLGNRMFQYAFGCSYAFQHNIIHYFPSEWEGTVLFKPFPHALPIPDGEFRDCLRNAHEGTAHGGTDEGREECVTNVLGEGVECRDFNHKELDGNTNLAFQDIAMMYFKDKMQVMCTEFIRNSVFSFSDLVKGTEMYKDLESRKSTYVVVHVRRGDIVASNYENQSHVAITLDSYKKQLQTLGIANDDVIWISEDTSIATKHKWYFPNGDMGWKYPNGQKYLDKNTIFDFLPDLLTIYFAGTILRGNSGFSWWAAELSGSNVYSPVVPDRPAGVKGAHWVDCDFVNDNTAHFMGARFDPIVFRKQCTPDESKFIASIAIHHPSKQPCTLSTDLSRRKRLTLISVLCVILALCASIKLYSARSRHPRSIPRISRVTI